MDGLPSCNAADVLDEMAPDHAADVIHAIKAEEPERAHPILVEMDRAGHVQALLAYLPDTAGGRMTPTHLSLTEDVDFVTLRCLRCGWTALFSATGAKAEMIADDARAHNCAGR